MEHGGAVEDAFTHLRMGHRPGAVHADHLSDNGSGAMGRVHSALPRRSTHQCLRYGVHGLEDLERVPDMSRLFD